MRRLRENKSERGTFQTKGSDQGSYIVKMEDKKAPWHIEMVSIRELHNRTGEVVRRARDGEIYVTERGTVIAKLVPETVITVRHGFRLDDKPYFARRKVSPAFQRLHDSGRAGRGTDSTDTISADRDER